MASQLSTEQAELFRQAFNLFDKTGEGKLSIERMKQIYESVGLYPGEQEFSEIFKKIDTNQDFFVDINEFQAFMSSKLVDSYNEEQLIEAFKVFDKEDNGIIPVAELQYVLQSLGAIMSPEEIKVMLEDCDTEKNGMIKYQNFVKTIINPK